MLRLNTLGTLTVEGPTGPLGGAGAQPKALALLALLAGAGSRGVPRERVASYLWPDGSGSKVTHRLTQLLYSLRRDLGADDLFFGSGPLRLNPGVIASDVADFCQALEGGDFAAAARCYRGPFLDGFFLKDAPEFERWAEAERGRLADRYRSVLGQLAHAAEHRGDLTAAAGWWKELVAADPLEVTAVEHYLDVLEALGDRSGAVRFLRSYQAMVRAEFDLEADPRVTGRATRLEAATEPAPALPAAPAVAVLPFANLTPDQENQYFTDGMTEELTDTLSRVPGLRVASGLAARSLPVTAADPPAIAAHLGVSLLVCGSVRKVGHRIRIAAQLVDGRDGRQIWSETWDRTLDDVFALQEEISRAIVAVLPLPADPGPAPLVMTPTPRLDAYTLYLRGRYAAHRRTPEALALGAEYFEQAVEQDPRYALAHAGLAECLVLQGFPEFCSVLPLTVMPRARQAALEALRLDPRLPAAHTWMGVVHLLFDWDWSGAEVEFRRALQLKRDDAYAQTWYGVFLGAMGRPEESLRHILYAEALEPAAPQIRLSVPRAYYWAGQFEAALESVLDLWRADSGSSLVALWAARVLTAMGRHEEALAMIEQLPPGHRSRYATSFMAVSLAALGRVAEARRQCESLRDSAEAGDCAPLYGLCRAYWLLGDVDASLAMLRLSIRQRSGLLAFVAVDHDYASMRAHPAFEAALADLGLPRRPVAAT